MGRRRWRFITIVAFLLFIKGSQCQGDSDFYYTPHVERSFAQVQPPLFPDSRPTSFYEHGDSIRLPTRSNQPSYNEGQVRFPSPNYNQNPSPFQVPTGRSQSGGQYYVNQPDYNGAAQRQRFKPSLPHNYQFVYSTKKPDIPQQIHSAAYQNDPSKPETFLGQITLNNPDIDYLQNTRFKNNPFDNNSLKSNGQSGHISHDDYIENDNQDILDHKVTTYNPNKIFNKQIVSPKPNGSRFSHFEPPINRNGNYTNSHKTLIPNHQVNTPNIAVNSFGSSTEYKALLELEPLLEDDISDISTFRELMKSNRGSYDVEVIKFNNNTAEFIDDSKPDASFMNAGNAPKDLLRTSKPESTTKIYNPTTTRENKPENTDNIDHHEYTHSEEDNDSDNYESYYDENEDGEVNQTSTEINQATTVTQKNEYSTDVYDEYDSTEEPDKTDVTENTTQIFDVLAIKHNRSMVKDDNFKHFVDTTVIDQIEVPAINDSSDEEIEPLHQKEIQNKNLNDMPSILGEEIVSVVTTKSVVNGTISIPQVTRHPVTEKIGTTTSIPAAPTSNFQGNDSSVPITTESWVVVASVQTSRSVSGARFLPFPTVEQEEKKQVLTDELDEKSDEISLLNQQISEAINNNSSVTTEDINDKLDSIQSELSSAVLSGALDKDNRNIELISETTTEPITTTTQSLNVFTLKSTQPSVLNEWSSPEPLPVMIKKFTPRLVLSTTPKPKRKPSLVTVMDDVSGLLPPGYKPRLTFKDKRTSTTSTTTTSTTTSSPLTSNKGGNSINSTQGRSSGINAKNKVILLDDKSLLPKEYKPKENKSLDNIFKTIHTDDISKFLPPGFKPIDQEESVTLDKNNNNNSKSDIPKTLSSHHTTSTSHENNNKYFKKTETSKILVDDITKFLPPGYKPSVNEDSEQKILIKDDISKFLPPGFKLPSTVESENKDPEDADNIKLIKDDTSDLLPPGYKPSTSEESDSKEIKKADISKFITDDINKFLPPGYKPPFSETHEKKTRQREPKVPVNSKIDLAALLPPGFKYNDTEKNVEIPVTFKVAAVSDLLPPGFKINETEVSSDISSTTKGPGSIKLHFPTRPGGKITRKTTPKPADLGPALVTPKIMKGFPTRASTEFTGWPSPSTTPFSIEKLLESQRNATATSPLSIDWSTEATTRRTTTTTTTTTTPPPTTTPGICRKECEIAATIKIIQGADWMPALQDPHTEEWQTLAKEVKDELNSVYSKSDLKKYYKNIHIDGFSKGSVIVDYFIELSEVEEKIDTLELKQLFHKSLTESKTQSVPEPSKSPLAEELNPDVMLGDQPDEERMKKSNEHMTKTLDKAAMKLEIGKFLMDPAYTEFIVVQKREEPKVAEENEEESFLPQWGIAVIVIAMASLLFVVIFGVTVLVNRQKNFKAKQPIPLSEDMLRELDKSHMGGYDETHQMKERELPYLPSGKRMSNAFIEQLAYPNPGDSWRSEWTPQLQKYMQHYGADSGRGSQVYGHTGNAFGYGGSQLYGQTGGGSQMYGYTGEYPRSHHSRRRSEYDSNF